MDWTVPLDTFGRVAVAGLLGLLIGIERERDGHPAGTRTVATVAIGASLFGVVSTTGFDGFIAGSSSTNVQVDVTRVASQVVVGIGFLGAGMIFRRGGTVQNLTTAATLWAVAAMGLAAGLGQVGLAVAVAALILVVLVAVPVPQAWIFARLTASARDLHVGVDAPGAPERVRRLIEAQPRIEVRSWQTEKHDGRTVLLVEVWSRAANDLDDLATVLAADDEVVDLRVRG